MQAKLRRQAAVNSSGIREECQSIFAETEEILCVSEAVQHGWRESGWRLQWQQELKAARSAQRLSLHLRSFEEHILAERLLPTFLQQRKAWLAQLQRVQTFPELISAARELRGALRTPSALRTLTRLAALRLKRVDVVPIVMDFLVGHRELSALAEAALLCAPSAPPKGGKVDLTRHILSARAALAHVLDLFS
jgi:hypothetical protein